MSEKEERTIVFECSASFSLNYGTGSVSSSGEAKIQLDKESISVLPKFGESIYLTFRDIIEVSSKDYKIYLNLTSNEVLILSDFGYQYEDFLRILSKLCNQVILKDLLMNESIRKSGVDAEFVHFDENNIEKTKGKCTVSLYETAVVIIPEKSEFKRIPYSDILEIHKEDRSLVITTESKQRLGFSMMGREFDPFNKTLSDSVNMLSVKVQSYLKEILPTADPLSIRKAAEFMKEGRAAKKSDIESVLPELWKALEKKLTDFEIKEEYEFLKSLSHQNKICIGLKRDLMGDLTGEYIWFLMPIYSTNSKQPGNVMAMEAITEKGTGKATYFFKILSRKRYPEFNNIEELHKEVDGFIKKINHCMLNINFRREPIYLTEERLDDPDYLKYKFAIQRIPELRILRELFIGRIIHRSADQWKKNVIDLLKFNISTDDDKAKWQKQEQEEQQENKTSTEKIN